MAIKGLRDTLLFAADERPLNWRAGLLLLDPNGTAPLTALTSAMKTKTTDDPDFNWWEKRMSDQRAALDVAITAPSTVFDFGTDGALNAGFREDQIAMIEDTGELVRVVSPITADTITVIRDLGDVIDSVVDPAIAGTNPFVVIIGTAHEEGSSRPDGINYDPVKRSNACQIFRNNLELTETAARTNLRTTEAVREAKREALQYHGNEIERAFIFGEFDSVSTLNGRPVRRTDGCIHYIESNEPDNVIIAGGAAGTDLEDIESFMERSFRFGSSQKMVFAGNRAMLTIQQIARRNAEYQLMQGQKEFGMNVSKLISPFGEWVLKTHPLLSRMPSADAGGTEYLNRDGWLLVLDMNELVYRPLRGRDTHFIGNQEDPGDDQMVSGFLTEAGLEIHHAETHLVVKDVTTAKVDDQP